MPLQNGTTSSNMSGPREGSTTVVGARPTDPESVRSLQGEDPWWDDSPACRFFGAAYIAQQTAVSCCGYACRRRPSGKYKKATAHTGNWAPCYQTDNRDEKNRTLYQFVEEYLQMDLKDPSFQAPDGIFAVANPGNDVGPLIENVQSLNRTVSNMVQLLQVHEATILHNLQMRYSHDEFMTSVGPILVVINPFQYIAHKYGMDIVASVQHYPGGA